jgi:hypothetical protein
LAYSSTMKMDVAYSFKKRMTLNGLLNIMPQKIELLFSLRGL